MLDTVTKNQIRFRLPQGKKFLVWLSHDVDRVHKQFYQSFYYSIRHLRLSHLLNYYRGQNTYWNFDKILDIEKKHGVQSTFFFLNESIKFNWLKPKTFVLAKGRYRIDEHRIVEVIRNIDRKGWEVGVHGSYNSFNDRALLFKEKSTLEEIVGHEVIGSRQHYLNLSIPETWQMHKDLGFKYDASFGSSHAPGFYKNVYYPFRPFNDHFIVFPLTIMEKALLGTYRDIPKAWQACLDIVKIAEEKQTLLSFLWHQRVFSTQDFPGYSDIYERIIEECQRRGALFCTGRDIFQYIQ